MYKLRDCQVEGFNSCIGTLTEQKKKSIAIAPTGYGKSLIIAKLTKEISDPILILQPSKELLVQNYRKFKAFGGSATICCASLKDKVKDGEDVFEIEPGKYKKCREVSDITFATSGTIRKYVDELKDLDVKKVIIDEVHLKTKAGSQTRKLLKKIGATNVLGLTATPMYLSGGMNGSRLTMINRSKNTIFKDICYVSQISEMINNGYWTPLKYQIMDTDKKTLKLNSSGSDYTEKSQKLYYDVNNLENEIIKKINSLVSDGRKQILVFLPSIEEADKLFKKIKLPCGIVHSKMSMHERDKHVRDFGKGKTNVMLNINCLSVGYDNPLIDTIITARPTSSISIYTQQIGRGVRLHDNKDNCLIVDYSGNVESFGNVEGLKYKKIDYYGWGLFNDKNEILTDYPIKSKIKPTVETLIIHEKEKLGLKVKNKDYGEVKFHFGKHKGKKIKDIYKNNKDYLIWIADKEDFNWYGKRGENLREAMFKVLKLPVPETHKEITFDDEF